MVDFKKFVKRDDKVDLENLISLFYSLDRQASHTDPRPAQKEALELLTERRSERDHILKISTGTGKTSIALLYLLSFMEELRQPVVYLCPTRQLIDQVYLESIKLGVKANIYPSGEPFPDVDGISAKGIIICTYAKLFNAKTTFDRSDVMLRPCAIVFDDAHAGIESIRDSFTLSLGKGYIYEKLIKILNEPCNNFNHGIWESIVNEDPHQHLEIPFWIWKPLLPHIEDTLSEHAQNDELKFVFPYIRDLLRWCRCVVSGGGIEVIPDVLPMHKSDAYMKAKHRLFMSATLADDSVLVRDLNVDLNSAKKPIVPKNDKGLGERMVLAPSLVDNSLNRSWVMKLCKSLSSKYKVVVLSPSEKKACDWEEVGATVFMGDDVTTAVEVLNREDGKLRFAVFVQRYDGIDLPDNSCRVLVIDGIPQGEGIIDKHDSSMSSTAGGVRNRLIYRIEQGIGRAVRSHADYAVVLLVGPELAHFIAKHEILYNMNADTQAQLKLAIDLAKLALEESESRVEDAIIDMIRKCLSRDAGWKQFYHETVTDFKNTECGITDKNKLLLGYAERQAFDSAISNNPNQSVTILRDAINNYLKSNNSNRGWYLQRVANYMNEIDPGEALEVQRAAYECNKSMSCPPTIVKRAKSVEKYDVQTAIMDWFKQFSNPNGAIAYINDLRSKLSYDLSPSIVEQSLCDLAPLVGAIGIRPEKEFGEGPDDLWLWPNISLVIEAKSQNIDSLHKRDAGQLLLSLQWFENNYPARDKPIPIIAANVVKCDKKSDFPEKTRIITQEKIKNLLETLEKFYLRIISEPIFASNPDSLISIQSSFKITPELFVENFTENIL